MLHHLQLEVQREAFAGWFISTWMILDDQWGLLTLPLPVLSNTVNWRQSALMFLQKNGSELYPLYELQVLELIDLLQYHSEKVNCLTFVNYLKIRSLDLQADDERLGTFVNDYLLLVEQILAVSSDWWTNQSQPISVAALSSALIMASRHLCKQNKDFIPTGVWWPEWQKTCVDCKTFQSGRC